AGVRGAIGGTVRAAVVTVRVRTAVSQALALALHVVGGSVGAAVVAARVGTAVGDALALSAGRGDVVVVDSHLRSSRRCRREPAGSRAIWPRVPAAGRDTRGLQFHYGTGPTSIRPMPPPVRRDRATASVPGRRRSSSSSSIYPRATPSSRSTRDGWASEAHAAGAPAQRLSDGGEHRGLDGAESGAVLAEDRLETPERRRDDLGLRSGVVDEARLLRLGPGIAVARAHRG